MGRQFSASDPRDFSMPFKVSVVEVVPFLKALGFHETKEWFEADRATSTRAERPIGDMVEDLSAAFAKAKLPLTGDRKRSPFRIHRDVRFSGQEPVQDQCRLRADARRREERPGPVLFPYRAG